MNDQTTPTVFDHFEQSEEKLPSFQIPEGETEIEFLNEPKHWYNTQDHQNVLILKIKVKDSAYQFFINERKFIIINGLRAMGLPLKGRKAIIGRVGTGRGKATRYTFKEVK